MQAKSDLKRQAISLRESGKTYREICELVPVAKSTLSLWLRSVGLSKKQHQVFSEKKQFAQAKGAAARRNKRIQQSNEIISLSKLHMSNMYLNKEALFILGVALYWAEGSKEKSYRVGAGVIFSNSDPRMVKVFLEWLFRCIGVSEDDIRLDIYVHETCQYNFDELKQYWQRVVGYNSKSFGTIYLKKHKLSSDRKKVAEEYYGLMRVRVKRSSTLNRKITGWIDGIYERCIHGEW